MPADGGDPATGFDGLRVRLASVVRSGGCFAGLPRPYVAVRISDDGLAIIGCDRVSFHAFRQADRCGAVLAIGQVPGLPVRVHEEEPLVEGLGLDGARARFLLDACGLGVSGIGRLPGPGLPVSVHDEDPAAGGDGGNGLRLSGQAGRGLLGEFRVQVLASGIARLIGVCLSLLVHGQQQVVVDADAGEPGVLAGVEDGGRRLLAGPGVDVLVGSQGGLPMAAGCGLQVAEPFRSLNRGGDLLGRAVLRPGVDAAVAGQTDQLVSCGLDGGELRLLPVGRADGQSRAGGGPVVRAQRPVRGLRPLGFQDRVLEDGSLQVERLAVMSPPVEPEALTLRILLRGNGEGAGLHGRLCWLAAVGRVETHHVRSLIFRLVGRLGCSGACAVGCARRR